MLSQNRTIRHRRNAARTATRTISARIRNEARAQGQTIAGLREATGLDARAVLRIWFGIDPSAWAIERCREVLGLSIEQVWKVR